MGFDALLAVADQATVKHLGGPVTYTPGTGPAVEVTGIFDATYQLAQAGQPGVSSSGPAVFFRLADLPSDPVTDTKATVTVGGRLYTQAEAKPDGKGGVLIRLFEGE
jgi:hypothetical protein